MLTCTPAQLAYLVEQGLLRASVRKYPYPQWETVRFDLVSVVALRSAPGELARARRSAPVFRVPEVERASAVGVLLRFLDQ